MKKSELKLILKLNPNINNLTLKQLKAVVAWMESAENSKTPKGSVVAGRKAHEPLTSEYAATLPLGTKLVVACPVKGSGLNIPRCLGATAILTKVEGPYIEVRWEPDSTGVPLWNGKYHPGAFAVDTRKFERFTNDSAYGVKVGTRVIYLGDDSKNEPLMKLTAKPGAIAIVSEPFDGDYLRVNWVKSTLASTQSDGGYWCHGFARLFPKDWGIEA